MKCETCGWPLTWWEVEPFWNRGRLRYRLVSKSDGTRPADAVDLGGLSYRWRWKAQRIADRWNLG